MFNYHHPLKSPLFDYFAPLGETFRGIISIPHSGETIPKEFSSYLTGDLKAYKEDVDYKVHELVDIPGLQKAGVAVLVAHIHRICIDLNRAEENCVLFWKNNTQGQMIVTCDPSDELKNHLIETYHRPYFEILKAAIQDLEKKKMGKVSMVDLHSMPSRPTGYHMLQNPHQKSHRPDFCISDRKGKTADPEFIQFFNQEFTKYGYESAFNDPYIGGYVTEFVDQFRTNNIQIEINRSIYMNEETKEIIPNLSGQLRPILTNVLVKAFERFDS